MATLTSSFHLDGLIIWISFTGLYTLAVESGISTNTTINNIYNEIYCPAILIHVCISMALALNFNSTKRQRMYFLNSCDTLITWDFFCDCFASATYIVVIDLLLPDFGSDNKPLHFQLTNCEFGKAKIIKRAFQ